MYISVIPGGAFGRPFRSVGLMLARTGVFSVISLLAACGEEPLCDIAANEIQFGVENPCDADGRGSAALSGAVSAVLSVEGADPGDALYIHAETRPSAPFAGAVADEAASLSRGQKVPDTDTHGSFGVLALMARKGAWKGTETPDMMYDVKVVRSGAAWVPESPSHWPGADREMRFYGYAPHGAAGVRLSAPDKGGTPTLSYTVPVSNPRQTDLFIGSTGTVAGDGSEGAGMKFSHALTAVSFAQGSSLLPGTVTRISIKGVHNSGVCDMGTGRWTCGATGDFSLSWKYPVRGESGKNITYESHTFFMIPQTLPEGATLEISYTDSISDTPRVLSADIGGTEWGAGTSVVYRLSSSSISVTPVLEVSGTPDFNNLGGLKNFYVTSYVEVARDGDETKRVPCKWTAEFMEYDTATGRWKEPGARPDWIKSFTESGAGGDTPSAGRCNVGVADETVDYSLDKALDVPEINGRIPDYNDFDHSKRYNLSNPAGAEDIVNTANCYVVNAPGAYAIPLVYGNAIKDGRPNPAAYTSSQTGDTILSPFVNHLGDPITGPYIYDHPGCEPKGARTVWRDGHFIVTEARVSDNKKWLTFNVKREYIKQGNAVLAVLGTIDGKETVLWSWHIWVTPRRPGDSDKAVFNAYGFHKYFMSWNLGWCEYPATYASRKVKVKITQEGEDGLSREFVVYQKGAAGAIDGNCPLYQYGRKDPMVPYERIGVAANKQWEARSGALVTTDLPASVFPEGKECVASCIRNPLTFCLNEFMDGTYTNLWSPVQKTVYDPSPVGYIMPDQNVFTGFTDTGKSTADPKLFNVRGEYCNGWEFYCEPGRTGSTIFFPANGGRRPEDGKVSLGSPVHYRTGVNHQFERNFARILMANDTLVIPNSSSRKAWAYGVRPVRE